MGTKVQNDRYKLPKSAKCGVQKCKMLMLSILTHYFFYLTKLN